MKYIAAAFHDQVCTINQMVNRIGESLRQGKISKGVQRATGQDSRDFNILIMLLDQPNKAVGNHPCAGYTDLFLNLRGRHKRIHSMGNDALTATTEKDLTAL